MKGRGFALGLTALLVVSVLAVFPPALAQDPTGRYGGTLRVGLLSAPVTDPTSPAAWADGNTVILDVLYDSLARVDPATGMFVPWAANSWTYDATNMSMVVELRGDMRFSDGSPFDSADVARSFQEYARFAGLVTAVDTNTVEFDFSAGNNAGYFFVEALTAHLAWDQAGTMRYSGPFAVDTSSATSLLLEANAHYWNGRPYLDFIQYTVYPDMATLACTMLLGSEAMDLVGVHLVPNDLYTEWNCGFPAGTEQNRSLINADALKTQPWTLLQKNVGTKQLNIGFNWANPLFQGAGSGRDLRRAIYMMMNKELYNQIEPNSIPTHSFTPNQNTAWLLPSWVYPSNAGFIGTGTGKRTNVEPAIKALVDAGYFDADGDGWRESGGADIALTVASPSFPLDPRKTTIGLDVQDTLDKAGLDGDNVEYGTWAGLLAAHTVNAMYVDVWDPLTTVPGYLYTLPDLVAANDPDVDTHLGLAAASTDLETVRLHLNHVMYYATKNAVLLPMVSFDSLQVVNTWNLAGWTPSVGGINSFWSMTSLGLPSNGPLEVSILPLDADVLAGDNVSVPVLVTDSAGLSVRGGEVWVGTGAGSPTAALDDGVASDQTANDGIYTAALTAPAVESTTDWSLTATAYAATYQSDSDTAWVSVHPDLGRLRISTSWDVRQITGTEDAVLTVVVRDASTNSPVSGAAVGASLALPGGALTPASGTTDASGTATFTFTATVDQRTYYTVSLVASASGYVSDSRTASVIADSAGTSPQVIERTNNVPALEAVAILAVVGLLVAVSRVRKQGK